MRYNILANDGIGEEGINVFIKERFVVSFGKFNVHELINTIHNYDALLVRSATKVTREVIEAGTKINGRLKIIGRAGVGYDNVDIKAAVENGVVVKYAPHGNTNATAELAFGLMIASARNIPQAHESLKNGIWMKKPFSGLEISNKTLGIIGCGRIGQRLSELVSGFGMELLGYDANPDHCKSRFQDSKIRYVGKDELLERSDFVSIHTGGKDVVIGKKEFELMKSESILINASRGSNVDEDALYGALRFGQIRGAGLDSYLSEPKCEGESVTESMKKLGSLDNIVFSSHLGASTSEAQSKTSREMAEVISDYLIYGSYKNSVNTTRPKDEETNSYSLFITHKDIPNVFGKISKVLGEYEINIRDNPSEVFREDGIANTVYLLQKPVPLEVISIISDIDEIIRVTD